MITENVIKIITTLRRMTVMNERMKGIIAGSLVTLMLTGGMTLAKNATEKADLTYRDIKITLNKEEVTPKDANGNVVEPFIINGTTYLPVRAVADALGLQVAWDDKTSTVALTDLPEVWATDYTNVVVKEGQCTLIDNPATNDQASKNALCFAEAYGTGRTTQGDAVKFEKVKFEKEVKKIGVRCGYNLGGDKAGTATEFWVYLDKIEGEPIAKVTVSDKETKSSQIVDQVIKYADVKIPAGEHDVYVVGGNEYSGSFSEVFFIYE